MKLLVRLALVAFAACVLASCAPPLPPGYHVDSSGERTANSEDQVAAGLKDLAAKTPKDAVLSTQLPHELTAVPVPGNAIARRYERKKRVADFCDGWRAALSIFPIVGYAGLTPSLDRLKDMRIDASAFYNGFHSIDPNKRYVDASIQLKRGESPKRRLPAEVKTAVSAVEAAAHTYYAQLYFAEQLEKRGKLDAATKHTLVQQALDGITGAEASQAFDFVNSFAIVHCLGGSA